MTNEDYLRARIAGLEDVLAQMLNHHRAQLPSEARDLYGGGCGCPLCRAALAALGEYEHCDDCTHGQQCRQQRRCHRAVGLFTEETS